MIIASKTLLNVTFCFKFVFSKKMFYFWIKIYKMTMHKFLEKDHVQFTKLAKFALGTMSIDEQEEVLEQIEKEKNKWLSLDSTKRRYQKIEAFAYKYVSVVLKFEFDKITVFDIVNRNFFNIQNYTTQNEVV